MKNIASAVLGLILIIGSAGSQSISPASPVPDEILWKHVLLHVAKYQQFASEAAARSQSSPYRHSFRARLGLNPIEEQDLNLIAADFAWGNRPLGLRPQKAQRQRVLPYVIQVPTHGIH